MITSVGQFCGIFSSICFICCSLPQVLQCFKQGHGRGINPLFMWVWQLGEVALLIYAISLNWNLILFFNSLGNMLLISIILYFIYFPRR